ncbi:MAG: hypothetical protein Q8R13_05495, partial [bacterium]|nr:hypothetical protein [bacterium]
MHSHVSDVTDTDNPVTAEDDLYLVNTQHIDDEDGTEYRVTRIAIHDDYIVAYRTSLRLDGQANRWE